MIKLARTSWLIEEPEAFGRLLVAAVEHLAKLAQGGAEFECARPYVRLNVLSDIPWEVVFPGLFDAFPAMQFYDYTKVPGRREAGVPRNYDLTFSFSGSNQRHCQRELELGGKVATVFFPPYWDVIDYRTMKPIHQALTRDQGRLWMRQHKLTAEEAYVTGARPETWLGYAVVDGDQSDVRPLDPNPCIVGLSYKPPNIRSEAKGGMLRSDVSREAPVAFVVQVFEVDGVLTTALVPGHEPGHQNQEKSDELPRGTKFLDLFEHAQPPELVR